jgi:hypothetical protein
MGPRIAVRYDRSRRPCYKSELTDAEWAEV